jgi:hypothetical protein
MISLLVVILSQTLLENSLIHQNVILSVTATLCIGASTRISRDLCVVLDTSIKISASSMGVCISNLALYHPHLH